MQLHNNFIQHCTTTERLWSSDLRGLCRSECCLWFTQPFIALVTADQVQDPWQDSQINQGPHTATSTVSCVRASQSESAWFTTESGIRQGCVLAPPHQTLSPRAWTGCWKELLAQPWMQHHLVRTLFQTWTLLTMSLFLPSYLNSLYLY